jgi:type I phosphodiesterase/nucleotide pyrophosphatase
VAARAVHRARPRARPALDRPGRRQLEPALSFAAIPGTIERLLTGSSSGTTLPLDGLTSSAERVLFVYLDAFPWRFVEKHAAHPLLARARSDGLVLRLESQFPSTTAAHATTLHSGQPVGVHGVYEWHVYEPSLDRLITPLRFSFAGDAGRETLRATGLAPEDVFPRESLHARLGADGVRSIACMPASIATSTTNRALLRGAAIVPFTDVRKGFARAAALLASAERVYASVYLPTLDATMHQVGPDAPAADAELLRLLWDTNEAIERMPPGTLVLLGTDHGMEPISPERTVYVNALWPELAPLLRYGADGKPLAPAGSCRDLFLHALPEHVDDVVDGLGERLGGTADVVKTRTLLDEGAFGDEISDAFRARLADVVVLPHAGESVWWFEPGRFEQPYFGQHGGRSPNETEIPLLALVT